MGHIGACLQENVSEYVRVWHSRDKNHVRAVCGPGLLRVFAEMSVTAWVPLMQYGKAVSPFGTGVNNITVCERWE